MELKYISDGEETLEAFDKRCGEMLSGRFIVADVRIRNILKSIAASRRLLSVFAHAAKSFDFDSEFDNAITVADGKKRIKLPDEPLRHIAFVYSLFWEIDMKNIDLHKLLNEYYAVGQNINDYYNYFKNGAVSMFKEYVDELYFDERIESQFTIQNS